MTAATAAAIGFAVLTSLSTFAGGLAALRFAARREALMALAGGVVLAAAFFDLLPEALQQARAQGVSTTLPLALAVAGYAVFWTADRLLHAHAHDARAGLFGAGGFVVHSYFDGLAIGLGFQVDLGVGLLVAAAVLGHDFSDGLNTVSYMLAHRQSVRRSVAMLAADALTPLAGALTATLLPIPGIAFPVAVGFFAGLFVFAATSRLLPAAAALGLRAGSGLALAGAAAMFLLSRAA